jgi:CRP/FNR family cyclic AMP-dependent transcriptional regulator
MIESKGLYQYLLENKTPRLAENVKLISVRRGQILYDTSEKFTSIYEVISGGVKLGGISTKGEEYIYELVMAGEFFGNLALLNDTFSEHCKSLTITQVRSYTPAFFKHLMMHDPVVAKWCYERIVFRWNKTESLLAHIRSYEPRERILSMYASLQKRIMVIDNRSVLLSRLVTNKDIADLTATTRQLVAETLKQYEECKNLTPVMFS